MYNMGPPSPQVMPSPQPTSQASNINNMARRGVWMLIWSVVPLMDRKTSIKKYSVELCPCIHVYNVLDPLDYGGNTCKFQLQL